MDTTVGTGSITNPTIPVGMEYPPTIGAGSGYDDSQQSNHDDLLAYLKERLDSDQPRASRRRHRAMRVDKMVSTWQMLSDADSQRDAREEATGKAQAMNFSLPLAHTHLDDMVSFFAGIYAPTAGSFFQTPKKELADKTKALVEKLNTDAKKGKYYKNLCKALRGLLKYNLGGFWNSWAPMDDSTAIQSQDGSEGRNLAEAADIYNIFWDTAISDPSDIRTEAEWAAQSMRKNRRWLVSRATRGMFFGVGAVAPTDGLSSNRAPTSYYRYPPDDAGITARNQRTAANGGTADWASYGATLSSEGLTLANEQYEIVHMYCWLNPRDFHLLHDDSTPYIADDYVLFEFWILNGIRIIKINPVAGDDALDAMKAEIPLYMGFLNQDDMGAEQRSIAELLHPFQSYGSFLLNSHVTGTRGSTVGITVYDPSVIDMGKVPEGDVVGRIPSKAPGRDVRSVIQNLSNEYRGNQTMQDLQLVLSIMQQLFPAQALPNQVAGIDRAIQSQVEAVLQGVSRRLHMLVRVMDDDILGPFRFALYENLVANESVETAGLTDAVVLQVLGSGLEQLNREAAESAMRQLLFAVIQNKEAMSEMDVIALMDYWSSLLNIGVSMREFAKQAPAPMADPNAPPGAGGMPPGAPPAPVPGQGP